MSAISARVTAVAFCGATLLATGPLSLAVADVALAGECVDGWRPMPIAASLERVQPMGAASLDGKPAWWVGKNTDPGQHAAIAQWRKGKWRRVDSPWRSGVGLTGISALSPSAAWVVGYYQSHAPDPLAARWNGTRWTNVPVPDMGGRMATLTDVVALGAKEAFAVGQRIVKARNGPVALQYASGDWTNVSPVLGPGEEGGLTAVSATPDGRHWAAGWRGFGGATRAWVGFLESGSWTELPAIDAGDGNTLLTDMDFHSSSDGLVVGFSERVAGGGYKPIVMHWDGVEWQPQPVPWGEAESVLLSSIAVDSTGQLALGGSIGRDTGPFAFLGSGGPEAWQTNGSLSTAHLSWAADVSPLKTGAFAVVAHGDETAAAFRTCTGGAAGGTPIGQSSTRIADVVGPAPSIDRASIDTATTAAIDGFEARDVTVAAGLDLNLSTYSGVVADFNADTWPDVFINRHLEDVPLLMTGGPDGFSNSHALFTYMDRHGCAAADVDASGLLDLFCSVGRWRGTGLTTQEFRLDVGSTGGTLATIEYGITDAPGRGRAASFVQLDGEAPALFVVNETMRTDGLPSFNRFFRNHEGEYFVPAPELGLDNAVGGSCVLSADLDGDADDELLLCVTESPDLLPGGLRVFDFDGDAFSDRTIEWGIEPGAEVDVEVADFDGDSRPDVAQLRGGMLRISLGLLPGFEEVFELPITRGIAIAIGDVNDDELPDVYLMRGGADLMLVNGGDGSSFDFVDIPQPAGSADDVIALDFDQNGLDDFLTFNGRYSNGRMKLIAFFPTEP